MAFRKDPPTISFDQIQWDEIGEEDPKTRMLAHVRIGDLDMHLEARQVIEDEEGQNTLEYQDDYERLIGISDVAFQTTIIDGREYLLFALPYGD